MSNLPQKAHMRSCRRIQAEKAQKAQKSGISVLEAYP
jgi:hypothetical protein